MGRSLERISAEMDAAKALEAQMAEGHIVVEIDPTLIDASFVPDRMEGSDEDHASLLDAIREQGNRCRSLYVLIRTRRALSGRIRPPTPARHAGA